MKRILALLIAALMLLGCSAFADEYADVDLTPYYEWADSLDTTGQNYDEHLTIQMASPYLVGDSEYYNNGDIVTRWFNQHFNMDWDLIDLSVENPDEKIRTMINSGDCPDVLRWFSFDITEISNYIDQGLFYRFPDDWRERWPNLAAMQDTVPAAAVLAERAEGTYTIFKAVYFSNMVSEHLVGHDAIHIRKDWAEAVGFELNDALSAKDLLEYARLVKEQDPGQVGDKLVPIALDTDYAGVMFLRYNYPVWNKIYKEDGQYKWGFADERTLECLKLYRQAYEEGLISPEFYVHSADDAKGMFTTTGVAGSWVNGGHVGYVVSVYQDIRDNLGDPDDKYATAAIIGNDGYYHDMQPGNFWGNTYFSADCPEEVFVRYMDMMEAGLSLEIREVFSNGFKGLNWDYDENGDKVVLKEIVPNTYPIHTFLSVCADDLAAAGGSVDPDYVKLTPVAQRNYDAKAEHYNPDCIIPIDFDQQGFSSDIHDQLTNINYGNMVINIVVSDEDVETLWKKAIEDNAYIVDPAIEELNEVFCK